MAVTAAVEHDNRLRDAVMWTFVIGSLVWTTLRWNTSVDSIKENLSVTGTIVFAAVLLVGEALFVAGGIILAMAAGITVFKGSGRSPKEWWRRVKHVKRTWRDNVRMAGTVSGVRFGLAMNGVGALLGVTGLTPAVAAVLTLPPSGWLTTVPFVFDVIGTIVLRVSLWPRSITEEVRQ